RHVDCISSSERKELSIILELTGALMLTAYSSSTALGRCAMPSAALLSTSLMMCPFCVNVDPFLVAQTHGHIPCRNSLS
ncbi:hypothetical protein FIBSPDRAFT_865008, partial [Athelia psychrophila]